MPEEHAAPFRAQLVYEQVADQIRMRIYSGEFAPASRLPSERELANRFGVSRPAVREAIGALQNEQLVVTLRGSGTYVCRELPSQQPAGTHAASATDDSPMATLEVRLLLEPSIARMAARKAQRSPEAERLLNAMAQVKDIDDPQQQQLWTESDRLFHRELAAMTGDSLLVRIADQIAQNMEQPLWQRLRDDGIYDAARIELYVAEHRLIYEAIVNGDETAAAFYVEQHLKRVSKDITQL
ncbi:FadR/GntR family transcriptional regulator [Vogesella sp. LIG4]|uniref:FadR/GntR family transcriptional regulator n=1 Tax=Vogesella sp. LIG4 TaxID=1192162 RepID=UPI00081FC3AF|nr:FadR/GntR family transcriptional regulator [Vogesella sp. LIG4]SCK16598.1 transcriptional regulator, GntR family [Vogesella sp. LIG4]